MLRISAIPLFLLAVAGCTTLGTERAATIGDLSGLDVEIAETDVEIAEDYSAVYRNDFDLLADLSVQDGLSSTPVGIIAGILLYEEARDEDVADMARARAMYQFSTSGLANCPEQGPIAPLRATTMTGARFLAGFFAGEKNDGSSVPAASTRIVPREASLFGGAEVATLPDEIDPAVVALHEPNLRAQDGKPMVFCEALRIGSMTATLPEAKDAHPYLQGIWSLLNEGMAVTREVEDAKGAYIPAGVMQMVESELVALERHVATGKSWNYRLMFDYASDDFAVSVDANSKMIILTSALVRHLLVVTALSKESELVRIEREAIAGNEVEPQISALVADARAEFRSSLSLALAHELAHIHLGKDGRLSVDESLADCHAVSTVRLTRGYVPLGLIGMLKPDSSSDASEFWSPESEQQIREVEKRLTDIEHWVVQVSSPDYLATACSEH